MNIHVKGWAYPALAAGFIGAVLPITAGAALANGGSAAKPSGSASPTSSPTSTATATPTSSPTTTSAFSGYSGEATSSPVKVEVFEPTIPIPTSPQGELDFGYSKVEADSTGTSGRASFLWPGDSVGEGASTIFAALGLPAQLGAQGYPEQVNATYPSSTTTQAQEPAPGTVMRTTAGDKQVQASNGYSTDCDVSNGDSSGSGNGPGGGQGPLPPLPTLPGIPGLPTLPLPGAGADVNPLTLLQSALTSRTAAVHPSRHHGSSSADKAGRAAGTPADGDSTSQCQIPAALDAVIDIGGYASNSASTADDKQAETGSRAAVADVRLLGGLVSFSGVTAKAVTTSDGQQGVASGEATYGTVSIGGTPFAVGPDGLEAAGQSQPIPGLPADPNAALAALGITITVPQPVFTTKGGKATSTVEGLIVTLDMKTLSPVLHQIPLGQVLDAVPFPPQASQLKNALGAVTDLSPRFVVHLGYATSKVETVQPIKLPVPKPHKSPSGSASPSASASSSASPSTGTSGTSTGSSTGPVTTGGSNPPGGTTTGSTSDATGTLPPSALSSGLPKLFSIPGLLMVGALVGAVFAGSYVRRVGVLVLGAGGACAHGLDSGLPDLRKVQ